jgi:putative Holliday junction resolvase
MKFLGIDYGTKRIGLAMSDENGKLAFPKEIILANNSAVKKIGEILKQENITEVVVGESMDFLGKENKVEDSIKLFILELGKNFSIKIHREKEFLTSVEARKMGNTKSTFQKNESHSRIKKTDDKKVDASAAALILQRFLDKFNK